MTLLKVENLDVRYGHFKAVRGISFEIAQGEILALIGANGAGKSTLLRALAGAIQPVSGRIHFDGNDVTGMPAHERVARGLVLVPEGRRLFARMTVEENLMLGAVAGRPGRWSIDEVFSLFPNLVKRRHAPAGALSGGEQQATAIGRALMTNPDLIFLDEVSLGLSPLVVDQVYAALATLTQTGTTIIIVEQDIRRAMGVAARALCLLEGEVRLDCPMEGINHEEITNAYFGLDRVATPEGTKA